MRGSYPSYEGYLKLPVLLVRDAGMAPSSGNKICLLIKPKKSSSSGNKICLLIKPKKSSGVQRTKVHDIDLCYHVTKEDIINKIKISSYTFQ